MGRSSNKIISEAFVSHNLPKDSSSIPIVSNSVMYFSQLQTTNSGLYVFDSSTGILTLKQKGYYTLHYNTFFKNSGNSQSLIGNCVLQNGALISGSQSLDVVNAGDFINLSTCVSFNADCEDKICLLVTFPNSTFQIPASPLNLGFGDQTPFTSGDWAPNSYSIVYNCKLDTGCAECDSD